jgi:predicted dithiol-disulfide oxidoreductase (DUF899 family)
MLQTINGTLRQTNLPNESEEYLSRREELCLAEIELRNQRERVAELRRKLPLSKQLTAPDLPEQQTYRSIHGILRDISVLIRWTSCCISTECLPIKMMMAVKCY